MQSAVSIPFASRAARGTAQSVPSASGPGSRPLAQAVQGLPAAAAGTVTFDIVSTRAGFDALEADWCALFERAGRPTQAFQDYNWMWHWANHYLPPAADRSAGSTLAIVTGRRDGVLVLVWPLVKERHAGVTCLGWMGAPVSQYGDVLVEDGPHAAEAIRASWMFIAAQLKPDLVRLRKVRADAAVAPLLAEIGAVSSDRQLAPYLDLASAPDFATYEGRYSAGSRRNRRRQMRRLEERGQIAFETHRGGPAARAVAVHGLALKRAWLKSRGLVSPALADDRMTRFMADAVGGETHPTGCRVLALTSAGRAAAIEIALTCKRRLLLHVLVYDLEFGKAGAGNILVEGSIRSVKADGFDTYDMLAPGDAYKMEWADGTVAVDDLAVALSRRGRLYAVLYLGFMRRRIKAAVAALPTGLRRALSGGLGKVMAVL